MDTIMKVESSVKGVKEVTKGVASIMIKLEKASETGKYLEKAAKFAQAATYLGYAGAAIGIVSLFVSEDPHKQIMNKLNDLENKIDDLKDFIEGRFEYIENVIKEETRLQDLRNSYATIDVIKAEVKKYTKGIEKMILQ